MSPGFAWLAVAGIMIWGVLSDDELVTVPDTSPQKAHICINYFSMCEGHMDVPSSYDDLELVMDPEIPNTMYVSGVLNMKEDIPADSKMLSELRQCENKDSVSCRKYLVHEVEDICSYLPMEGEAWSGFIQQIEGLSTKCPIPAGSYKMDEAPVDLSNFENFTEFPGHWQADISFITTEKRMGCITLDMNIAVRRASDDFSC